MKQHECYSPHFSVWFLLGLDYFTKLWAWSAFANPVVITSFLSFDLAINMGISWSMFSGVSSSIITALIGVFLFLLSWYSSKRRIEGLCTLGEKLVIVGGTGNFIDRLSYGGVVDFIHFSYGGWSFPIFNIADICICVGVGIIFWQTFFETPVHD